MNSKKIRNQKQIARPLRRNISYHIVPLSIHLRNSAKRSTQTFKDHFIASICSDYPKYPAQEWDRLLLQATMNLIFVRKSCTNPKLSAYAAIFGIHYFNWCPLALPGTKLIVHDGFGLLMEQMNDILSHQCNIIDV